MNIFRQFTSGFFRKLGYIAAALLVGLILSFFGTGKAHAQSAGSSCGAMTDGVTGFSPAYICDDEGMARAMMKQASESYWSRLSPGQTITYGQYFDPAQCTEYWEGNQYCGVGYRTMGSSSSETWRWWKSGDTCASRNTGIIHGSGRDDHWQDEAESCVSGCKFKIQGTPQTRTVFGSNAGAQPFTSTQFQGPWEYTGDTCPASSVSKPKTEEKKFTEPTCTPAGSGQTYCVYKDGKACATASSGRDICWMPSETGSKTDGATTQVKSPGDAPPSAIEGSSHKNKTSVTTNNNMSTTTQTINTYTTNNGSPAGPANEGGPSGTGTLPGGGSGTSPVPNAGASSGECATAPISTGDALLGAILRQEWDTGCKVEKAGGKLEGDPNCSDGGVVAFSCSGNQLLCKQTLTALEAKCQALDEKNRLISDGELDQGQETGDGDIWGDPDGDEPSLNSGLISVGGGGQLLPDITLEGFNFDLSNKIGPGVAAVRFIIIAMFSILAVMIAGGNKQ